MSTTMLAGLARTSEPQTMLRRFLALDAVVTGVNGLAYLAASGPLADLLGLDKTFLRGLGVFLIVFGLAVAALGGQREPSKAGVTIIIELNLIYAVVSIVSLFVWFDASIAGTVWIPAQALVVGGFALLQHFALKARATA